MADGGQIGQSHDSAADCFISVKFGSECDLIAADTLQTSKVKKVTAWRNISAVKCYKSGTNSLTDFKLRENLRSATCDTCSRLFSTGNKRLSDFRSLHRENTPKRRLIANLSLYCTKSGLLNLTAAMSYCDRKLGNKYQCLRENYWPEASNYQFMRMRCTNLARKRTRMTGATGGLNLQCIAITNLLLQYYHLLQ